MSRRHNDANVLCLGGRLLSEDEAWAITEVWLTTPFEGGRHEQRVALIDEGGASLEPGRPRVAARAALSPRPRAQRAAALRAHPPAGDARAHRQRELRQPRRPRGHRLGADQQVRRGRCPGARYYGGCEIVDQVEQLAIDRCKEVFGAEHVNVQPHSGSSANLAALFALLEPGDTIMAMELAHGGHLTHGLDINYSGRTYDVVPYHVRRDTETIDYDEVRELALEHRPKLIICGYSSYPRIVDFAAFRAIADECGAHAPRRHRPHRRPHRRRRASEPGAVLRRRHEHDAQDAHRPARRHHHVPRGVRRGDRPGRVPGHAGRAAHARHRRQGGVPARSPRASSSTSLQRQIVDNCAALAETLAEGGLRLVSGGTDVHLALLDLRSTGLTGLRVPGAPRERQHHRQPQRRAVRGRLVQRRQRSARRLAGGHARAGFMEPEMRQTGELMLRALAARGNDAALAEIRREVLDLLDRFPLYEFL